MKNLAKLVSVQAFNADQFDARPSESSSRSSFFNRWYFGICTSSTVRRGLEHAVHGHAARARRLLLAFSLTT